MHKGQTLSKAVTWDGLANLYDKHHPNGRPARTLPMDSILEWALSRKDLFYVHPDENTIHQYVEEA